MSNTTTEIGRLKLLHPDFKHDGGTALHTLVRNAWLKLSDVINSRFFTVDALANGGTANFEHNFKTAFTELRINLYLRNTTTGELTRIVSGGTPDLSAFAIVATPGSETTQISITNNSGAARDLAVVVVHGKGAEKINDLDDVDTTGVVDQNALIYDAVLQKWVPGEAAGGQKVYDAIVDASGDGDYTSIAAACAAMGVLATIYVRNGVYNETSQITLKFGQHIIGESKTGVIVTTTVTTQLITCPNAFHAWQSTLPTTDNTGFDSVNGIGTVSIVKDSTTVTYTGTNNAVNNTFAYILNDWYLVSNVNTGAKTFSVDRPVLKATQSNIPWRMAYTTGSPGMPDYHITPNITRGIKNITYNAGTTAGFIAASNVHNLEVDNIDIISTAWQTTSKGHILDAYTLTNCKFTNIRYFNNFPTIPAAHPRVLQTGFIWHCIFENWEVNGARWCSISGSTSTGFNYQSKIHFKRFSGDSVMFLSTGFIQECELLFGDINVFAITQNEKNFYKCKLDFTNTILGASTNYIVGHENVINLGNMNLRAAGGNLKVLKSQASGYLAKNIIASGSVVGLGYLQVDDSVFLGDSVYTTTLTGVPARAYSSKVFTVVVDAGGGGDYTSIGAACTGSPVGATIYIRNGSYNENQITVKRGQQLIGESKSGVKITTISGSIGILLTGTYNLGYRSQLNADGETFSETNGIGLATTVADSDIVSYTITATVHPTVNWFVRICGEWFKVIAVDEIARTFQIDRPFNKSSFSKVPIIFVQPGAADYPLHISQRNPVVLRNFSLFTGAITAALGIYFNDQVGIHIEDVDVFGENATGSFSSFVGNNAIDAKIINCGHYALGATTALSRLEMQYGWENVIENFTQVGCRHNLFHGNASLPSYRCRYHWKHLVGRENLFQSFSAMYECEIGAEFIQSQRIIEQASGIATSKCTFRLGTVRTSGVSIIRGIGNRFFIKDWVDQNNSMLTIAKATISTSTTPYNKLMAGNYTGNITVDDTVVITDGFHWIGTRTGTPAFIPVGHPS